MRSNQGKQHSVMIAAGGLGTRRAGWSRFLPKEYFPVHGKPGIALLMEEIADLENARTVMVHHPYYTRFAAWISYVLNKPDAYDQVADTATETRHWPSVDMIPQSGTYGDITSVLNADDYLNRPAQLYVMYADNLFPNARPLLHLGELDADTAVMVRPYTRAAATKRGVVVCDNDRMVRLVEKPDEDTAAALEATYGCDNLALMTGRSRVSRSFLDFLHTYRHSSGEPKLSLALSTYAQTASVRVQRVDTTVTDLGAPFPNVD